MTKGKVKRGSKESFFLRAEIDSTWAAYVYAPQKTWREAHQGEQAVGLSVDLARGNASRPRLPC